MKIERVVVLALLLSILAAAGGAVVAKEVGARERVRAECEAQYRGTPAAIPGCIAWLPSK